MKSAPGLVLLLASSAALTTVAVSPAVLEGLGRLARDVREEDGRVRLRVDGEERLLVDMKEAIRDVRQGPDGALYLLTDGGQGRLLKLVP